MNEQRVTVLPHVIPQIEKRLQEVRIIAERNETRLDEARTREENLYTRIIEPLQEEIASLRKDLGAMQIRMAGIVAGVGVLASLVGGTGGSLLAALFGG